MYKSGLLFGALTLICVIGAGVLMVQQALRGESVMAQPIISPSMAYNLPVAAGQVKSTAASARFRIKSAYSQKTLSF